MEKKFTFRYKITAYRCPKCRYEWIARVKKTTPKLCPKCKKRLTDPPKKKK